MKSKMVVVGSGIVLALVSGCQSVKVEPGSDRHVSTRGTVEQETQIVRSSIPVQVKDVSVPAQGFTSDVAELTKGRLAAGGFLVNEKQAYVSVDLSTQVKLFDKMGNYYVYEGQCGILVKRADGKMLASELVSVKSSRVLDSQRAMVDARRKIAAKAGEIATQVVSAKTTGMESQIIVMKKVSESGAHSMAKVIRGKAGVYSFERIPGETDGIQYRIIYDARSFPDGINLMVERASRL